MTHIRELPYPIDSSRVFRLISHKEFAIWLDSQGSDAIEIMSACPSMKSQHCEKNHNLDYSLASNGNSTNDILLQNILERMHSTPANLKLSDFSFQGGLIGYWSYDSFQITPSSEYALPKSAFGYYDWFIQIDHRKQKAHLVFLDSCPEHTRQEIENCLEQEALNQSSPFKLTKPFTPVTPKTQYKAAIEKIHQYILSGDCYQVNYTQSFLAHYEGDPLDAYLEVRKTSRSPFSAYMSYPFGSVLCFSPERFLLLTDEGQISTKPIKGTAPRFDDPTKDKESAETLLNSAKDRAENVMITDLLRNDLGQEAVTGSVHVDKLCALESFSLVHHLVSTVTATLKPDSSPFKLFKSAFPGGSITGAPKKRAMEIIDELEVSPRSVYCGSIGYISNHGRMDMNIAIRTLTCKDGEIRAWAGGGITIDSKWEEEYQECFNKIGGILKTLESMK